MSPGLKKVRPKKKKKNQGSQTVVKFGHIALNAVKCHAYKPYDSQRNWRVVAWRSLAALASNNVKGSVQRYCEPVLCVN